MSRSGDPRARLTKACELLNSDKPGEVLATAAATRRILAKAGWSWSDAFSANPADERREPLIGRWRAVRVELQRRPRDLRQWERRFANELPNFPRISTKQRYVLAEIARRVLGRGEG
jgi:hypothetical protein